MAPGEIDNVKRCRFAGLIAAGFKPFVLEDRQVHGNGPLRDGVHFSNVAASLSLDLPDADHWAVPHAAIELLQAEVKIGWAQIHRAIGAVGKGLHRSHHSIIFLAKLLRSRMLIGRISLRKNESLHPHSIHARYQESHALLGGVARHRTEMRVLVPHPQGPAQLGVATEFPGLSLGKCHGGACAKTLQYGSPVRQ